MSNSRDTQLAPTCRDGLVPMSDSTRIHVERWGRGRPLVLLHAWGLSGQMWSRQLGPFMEARFECITIDRRGHGRSDRPARGYDVARLVADVVEVVDALGVGSLTLMGHSMGGLEAVVAAAGPLRGRVERLILSAPTTPRLMAGAGHPNGFPRDVLEDNLAALSGDIGAWLTANAPGYWGTDDDVATVHLEWTLQQIFATPTPVLAATNRSMFEADVRDDLAHIDCPTLVVHGDADLSAPVALTGEPTAALLPNAELVVVPRAGHGLYVSFADLYNRTVLDFLGRTVASS